MHRITSVVLASLLVSCASTQAAKSERADAASSPRLGNFSVSLTVKDLAASHAFYEKLGFRVVGGDAAQKWLVLRNGDSKIGLFQGMFPRNMLTFNPGWDSDKNTLADFDDVREIQRVLEQRGLPLDMKADPATSGPASVMLTDPDGNPILIDQHVGSPKR